MQFIFELLEFRKKFWETGVVLLSHTLPSQWKTYTKTHFPGLSLPFLAARIQIRDTGRLLGTSLCVAHGFYLLCLLQSLSRVRAMSSTARLDPVFLAFGFVITKEIVLTALMNLTLVVRE